MKHLIAIAVMLLCAFVCNAQDMITTKDGENLSVKILKIGDDSIEYKDFDDVEGPTYTIDKNDIVLIQYANGMDVLMTKTTDPTYKKAVLGIIRYKDIKYDYDYKQYQPAAFDRYSRGWAGVASAFIPGLGQAVDGEWGRAAGFFFGSVFLNILTFSNMSHYTDEYGSIIYEWNSGAATFAAANLALDIWSIIDAVRVAKVKNMYIQDITGVHASIDVDLQPYFAYEPHIGSPTAGVALRLSF